MLLFVSAALAAPPTAADCGACHAAAYETWRRSRHAVAATNPVFRAAWTHWPNGWCLGCHAPRPAQQVALLGHVARDGVLQQVPDQPPGRLHEDGVDCASCHVTDEGIRTASAPTAAGIAVHTLVHEPAFASEQTCAACHEFPFQRHTPKLPFAYGETLAQATVEEWRGSAAAARGESCIDCHMADAGHRFPGAHDPDFVRAAITVEPEITGTSLTVTVAAPGAGHAFPTGDPFRRLELWLCATPLCMAPTPIAWFRRTLRLTEESWAIDEDLRVPADGARAVTVPLLPDTGHWQLVYRYGDRRFEAKLPPAEVGYVLASGPIPQETR